MTLLTPFLMAAIVVIPTYLAMNTTEERHIAILDESNLLPILETKDEITFFHYVSGDIETEKENLDTDEFYALVHIPASQNLEELKDKITIYSDKQVSLSVRGQIENLIENKAEKIKLAESGIDSQTLKDANINFDLKTIILVVGGIVSLTMSYSTLIKKIEFNSEQIEIAKKLPPTQLSNSTNFRSCWRTMDFIDSTQSNKWN